MRGFDWSFLFVAALVCTGALFAAEDGRRPPVGCGSDIAGDGGGTNLEWLHPPRHIVGYTGPAGRPEDGPFTPESRAIERIATIYVGLDRQNGRWFTAFGPMRENDRTAATLNFIALNEYAISIFTPESIAQPRFATKAGEIVRGREGTIGIALNPNTWEQDPNLTVAEQGTRLFIMHQMVHGDLLTSCRSRLDERTLDYVYGDKGLARIDAPPSFSRAPDALVSIFSDLYGQHALMESYAEWIEGDYPNMRNETLDGRYAAYRENPRKYLIEYLMATWLVPESDEAYDITRAREAASDIVDLALPTDWPIPRLPRAPRLPR